MHVLKAGPSSHAAAMTRAAHHCTVAPMSPSLHDRPRSQIVTCELAALLLFCGQRPALGASFFKPRRTALLRRRPPRRASGGAIYETPLRYERRGHGASGGAVLRVESPVQLYARGGAGMRAEALRCEQWRCGASKVMPTGALWRWSWREAAGPRPTGEAAASKHHCQLAIMVSDIRPPLMSDAMQRALRRACRLDHCRLDHARTPTHPSPPRRRRR